MCKKEIVPLCTKQQVKVPKEVDIIINIIINIIIILIILVILIMIRFARGCPRIFARTRLRNDALRHNAITT